MAPAGQRAFEDAGIGPKDIDFAALHDAFTISVLVTLDALGFSRPGEAGAMVRGGATKLGGSLPLNTHGGLLSQ
ncbi:MAG: thiolase family protein, partial [Rhizobiales bacterium]|nr:thiolase family protein [Hyphomicrobiales bacterium]